MRASRIKKLMLGFCIFSAGTFLAATTTFASWDEPITQDFSAGNPASLSLTQTRASIGRMTDKLLQTIPHAAAEADSWFRNPSVFGEYAYNATHDNRLGGFRTHLNSGTYGLDFLTKGDVVIDLSSNYGGTGGHSHFPGHITDDASNYGFTLSASKSFDRFYTGLSFGYGSSDTLMVTPVGNRLKIFDDSYTLAPFVGAMYAKGNFSFSTTPTFVIRWQNFDYNTTPSDDSSDTTFVWMNTASYNVTEKLKVSLIFNWSHIIAEDTTRLPQTSADPDWLTIGPKITYHLTDKFSVYAAFAADLITSTYDNDQVTAGLTFRF